MIGYTSIFIHVFFLFFLFFYTTSSPPSVPSVFLNSSIMLVCYCHIYHYMIHNYIKLWPKLVECKISTSFLSWGTTFLIGSRDRIKLGCVVNCYKIACSGIRQSSINFTKSEIIISLSSSGLHFLRTRAN